MILANLAKAIREQNYYAVVLEFLIVIAGVVIGFQITAWNNEQSDQALARSSLMELREDFQANLDEINGRATAHENVIEAMLFLLEESARQTPEASGEEIRDAFRHIQHMPTYSPITRTYDNLIGSGNLTLIAGRDLQRALSGFNRQFGTTRLVQNTHELELVHTFQPYIIENLDYSEVSYDRSRGDYPIPAIYEPGRLMDVLNDREFRNVVIQKWTISTDLLEQMRLLRNEARTVIDLLDSQLDEPS